MKATYEYNGNNAKYYQECLSTLLTTIEGTYPGDRRFGMDSEYISLPPNEAKNLFIIDLHEKINEYIPGIEVEDVTFSSDGQNLKAHIKLRKGGEEEA